jgi:hypothetical protein
MTGRDHIAGQVGSYNNMVGIGKGITQEDARTTINNNFGEHLRDRFEEDPDAGVQELTRFVYQLLTRISLIEYRQNQQERVNGVAFAIIFFLLMAIVYKLWFGGA